MSVYHDMARDAGTHIDAGISLDEAAAMHEQAERDEYVRWAAEQQAIAEAEAEAYGMAEYEAAQHDGGA